MRSTQIVALACWLSFVALLWLLLLDVIKLDWSKLTIMVVWLIVGTGAALLAARYRPKG